jgi:hypothetical protein
MAEQIDINLNYPNRREGRQSSVPPAGSPPIPPRTSVPPTGATPRPEPRGGIEAGVTAQDQNFNQLTESSEGVAAELLNLMSILSDVSPTVRKVFLISRKVFQIHKNAADSLAKGAQLANRNMKMQSESSSKKQDKAEDFEQQIPDLISFLKAFKPRPTQEQTVNPPVTRETQTPSEQTPSFVSFFENLKSTFKSIFSKKETITNDQIQEAGEIKPKLFSFESLGKFFRSSKKEETEDESRGPATSFEDFASKWKQLVSNTGEIKAQTETGERIRIAPTVGNMFKSLVNKTSPIDPPPIPQNNSQGFGSKFMQKMFKPLNVGMNLVKNNFVILSKVFGAISIAGLAAAATFRVVSGSVSNFINSIKEISPEVKVAEAQAKVAETMAAIKLNQESGGQAGEIITAQSGFKIALMELWSDITSVFGPLFVQITNLGTWIVKLISGILRLVQPIFMLLGAIGEIVVDGIQLIINVLNLILGALTFGFVQIPDINTRPRGGLPNPFFRFFRLFPEEALAGI